jgi:hypothetical protein
MASKYIKKFKVPDNFENILSDFAKEILRNQPKDIIDFGIEYFKGIETNTKLDYANKGENRPENYKRPENQKPNIINAPNNLEISKEDQNRLRRSMEKIDRINKDPVVVHEEKKEEEKKEEISKDKEQKEEIVQKEENLQKIEKIEQKEEKIEQKEEKIEQKEEKIEKNEEKIETVEYETGSHVVKYEQETVTQKIEEGGETKITKQVTVITKEKVIKDGEVIKDESNIQQMISSPEDLPKEGVSKKTEDSPKANTRYELEEQKEDNKKDNKDYDGWFLRHSQVKGKIDYKPEPPEQKEQIFVRNEIDYDTWFVNHSGEKKNVQEIKDVKEENTQINKEEKVEEVKEENTQINKEEKVEEKKDVKTDENGNNYESWFLRHTNQKIIDYKPEPINFGDIPRVEIDYPTWFENHSKLTNKKSN